MNSTLANNLWRAKIHYLSFALSALMFIALFMSQWNFIANDWLKHHFYNDSIRYTASLFIVMGVELTSYILFATLALTYQVSPRQWIVKMIVAFALAKSFSLYISVSGALKANELYMRKPEEASPEYADSVKNYYDNRISEIRNNPNSYNGERLSKIDATCQKLTSEIAAIKADKANYYDGVLSYQAQKVIAQKEAVIAKNEELKTKIHGDDTTLMNSEKEVERLQELRTEKLEAIAESKAEFNEKLGGTNRASWIFTVFMELFVLFFVWLGNFIKNNRTEKTDAEIEKLEARAEREHAKMIIKLAAQADAKNRMQTTLEKHTLDAVKRGKLRTQTEVASALGISLNDWNRHYKHTPMGQEIYRNLVRKTSGSAANQNQV